MTRTCANPFCDQPAVGRSKYCAPHRYAARVAWKNRIAEQAGAREDRDARFRAAFNEARRFGLEAGQAVVPRPMVVTDGRGYEEYVSEGMCGFAWVTVPGNTAFGRWAKRNAGFRKAHPKGLMHWVSDFGQSYERKVAYARAFAAYLRRTVEPKAYSSYRLD